MARFFGHVLVLLDMSNSYPSNVEAASFLFSEMTKYVVALGDVDIVGTQVTSSAVHLNNNLAPCQQRSTHEMRRMIVAR